MTLSGSVVAKTNFTCAGGSSTSLSRALKPCVVTMCASSMMKTLYRSRAGAKTARSRRSRASSTPPWLAASISTTSRLPGPPVASSPARAGAARRVRGPLGTVEAAGEDAGRGGLAAAARSGEEVGVGGPVRAQRCTQRVRHVLLADDVGEGVRSVPAVQGCGHASQGRRGDRHRGRGGGRPVDSAPRARRRHPSGRTRTPRTPVRARLPLLPSGPGGVQRDDAARGVGKKSTCPRASPHDEAVIAARCEPVTNEEAPVQPPALRSSGNSC